MTTETQQKEPNPYNMNKSWHTDVKETHMDNANSLFVPPTKSVEQETQTPVVDKQEGTKPEDKTEKRYFDLKSYHDKTVTELRNEIKTLKEKTEAAGGNAQMPKTEAELTSFKQKNPELFDMIVALARRETADKDKDVKAQLEQIEQRELKQKAAEAAEAVQRAHPDFDKLKADDAFHDWAEQQSEEIQSWIYNNPYNARNAIAAITLYKASKGSVVKQESSKETSTSSTSADAASLVSTRTQDTGTSQEKVWTPQEISKMSLDDYEKYREQILSQARQSRGNR